MKIEHPLQGEAFAELGCLHWVEKPDFAKECFGKAANLGVEVEKYSQYLLLQDEIEHSTIDKTEPIEQLKMK